MKNNDILVSIECLTYNHEKYIKQALDSFLAQKTSFRFEIIVHDDASTDCTQRIIREYYERYPDIIVPILQAENKMQSIGSIQMHKLFIYPYVHGKYLAICEGDDFWTDVNKLQKQIDYLESHPECSYSFHNAVFVLNDGTSKKKNVLPDISYTARGWKNRDHIVNMPEIISLGFIPTASIVARSEYILNRRYFCPKPVCGDLPLRLSLAIDGDGYYFRETMSAYRTANNNSASGQARKTKEKYLENINGQIEILRAFDKFTGYQWHSDVNEDILRRRVGAYMFFGDLSNIWRDKELRRVFVKRIKLRGKIHFLGKAVLGNRYEVLKKTLKY